MVPLPEMIRGGTSWVADPGSSQPEAPIKAAMDLGLRACITRSTRDLSDPMRPTPDDLNVSPEAAVRKVDDLYSQWNGAGGGPIRLWHVLRPSSNVSDELCKVGKSRARSRGEGSKAHLAAQSGPTRDGSK